MADGGENLVVVQPTAQTIKVQASGGAVTIAPAQQRVNPTAPPVVVQVTPTVTRETVADPEQVVVREQVQSVVRAGGGLQGPPGPPGPTGPPGDVTFVFTQGVPSALWTIAHNLQRYPAVTVVDSAGTEVKGNVQYISANQLTIAFSVPFGGVCYLN